MAEQTGISSNTDPIIIVSGLPRSGTSLMMQILQNAGIPICSDDRRKADEFNPKGYFEFQRVKSLPDDSSWLKNVRGSAIKIISQLLEYLPDHHHYKIIFMVRDLKEIIDSQNKMLQNKGHQSQLNADRLLIIFNKHLQYITRFLKQKNYTDLLFINYNQLLDNPQAQLKKVKKFLKTMADMDQAPEVINKNLYRSKF